MKLLSKEFSGDPGVEELLKGPFLHFKVSREAAHPGFKVVYDCQGSVDGKLVPATCTRFQEEILGEGTLLPEFERHLEGIDPGESTRFDMTFPSDYGHEDLAGKVAMFRVRVHYVMEPVTVENYKDLGNEVLRNEYGLGDTEALRQHNINLCYRVLHRADASGINANTTDSVMLMNLYLKLGFVDRATAIAQMLTKEPRVLSYAAHIFRINGQPQKALELLDGIGQEGPRERLIRAQSLFDLNRAEESETTVKDVRLLNNIQLAELRVQLAARLALPIETYLEREEALLDARTQAML